MTGSGLSHDGLCAADLALNLLASPSGRLNRPRLELAVRLGLLDHGSQPVLTEGVDEFAIGIGLGQVTSSKSQRQVLLAEGVSAAGTYPMTPMDARIRASLRFMSLAMLLRRLKMVGTYGWRTWAAIVLALSIVDW